MCFMGKFPQRSKVFPCQRIASLYFNFSLPALEGLPSMVWLLYTTECFPSFNKFPSIKSLKDWLLKLVRWGWALGRLEHPGIRKFNCRMGLVASPRWCTCVNLIRLMWSQHWPFCGEFNMEKYCVSLWATSEANAMLKQWFLPALTLKFHSSPFLVCLWCLQRSHSSTER